MKRPDLAAMLERWTTALRLRDWRIDIEYVRDLTAADGTPVYGLCSPFLDAKRARIQLRDPATPAFEGDEHDVEDTLVHELLHLHFAPLAQNSGPGIAAEEQAVWSITEALTSLKDSGAQARLARAITQAAPHVTPVPHARTERKKTMDPVILALLKAALTADDPKALIEQVISAVEGADAPADAATDEALEAAAAADENAARSAEASEDDAERTQRAAAVAPPAAAARRAAPAAPPAAVRVPASQVVSRKEFDRFRIEQLLAGRPDLTTAQRAFAIDLPFASAERWLAVTPVAAASAAGAPAGTRAKLGTRPTQGAGASQRTSTVPEHLATEIDRRMGIPARSAQAVTRDEATGRLTISALQPVRVTEGG